MLNSTQPKNDKCCCCLSMKFGVGLQWGFDLLLCVIALWFMFHTETGNAMDNIKSQLQNGISDHDCQMMVQLILFSIVSVVSVVSGAIGAFGKIKLAQNVFNISSIIESVQLIFCCIFWIIWPIIWPIIWATNTFNVAGCVGMLAALHTYGNINTNKFVKSTN
eukprot:67033_1